MRYQTRIEEPRFGVCSTYLASLTPHPSGAVKAEGGGPAATEDGMAATEGGGMAAEGGGMAVEGGGAAAGARVAVWLRASELRLPASDAAPILMVGPGTGVAPFRAFVQERAARRMRHAGGGGDGGVGDTVLYFGCQGQQKDFLYWREWEEHLASGALQAFHTAFSREGATKVYVQHRMVEPPNAAAVWEVMQHGQSAPLAGPQLVLCAPLGAPSGSGWLDTRPGRAQATGCSS